MNFYRHDRLFVFRLLTVIALISACKRSPEATSKNSTVTTDQLEKEAAKVALLRAEIEALKAKSNIATPPLIEPKHIPNKVFRSLNRALSITLVSSDELELTTKGPTYLCKYSEHEGNMRVTMTASGSNQVLYFRRVPDGLQSNDGMTLYSADFLLERCLSNAKQIGTACIIYAVDNNGDFPKNLDQLVPEYLPDRSIFSSPLAPKYGSVDYEYLGSGLNDTDSAGKVLLRGRYTTTDGTRSVMRFDAKGKLAGLVERQ